jgi:NADH-quinone oxidoreductase subunit C
MDAPLEPRGLFDVVQRRVGDAVYDFTSEGTKDPFFRVQAARWPEVATCLRDDPQLRLGFLQNLTAVDWIKLEKIEVVYHLWSYARKHGCVVKIDLPRARPEVPSVAHIWHAADWYEREQFDLIGVAFVGHPDLRRIMLPDDWPGHPMRKDYQEATQYRGMPTTRPNTLDLLPIWDKAGEKPGGGAK